VNAVIQTPLPQEENAMKSSIRTFALATIAAIACLQMPAQSLASQVNVPFAFNCGIGALSRWNLRHQHAG